MYFFSLDAASTFAVRAARLLLNLPYYKAAMTIAPADDGLRYHCARERGDARFSATHTPVGPSFAAAPGSLEYFLSERYCLFHVDRRGRPYVLEIHHRPWSLRAATADVTANTMAAARGIQLPERAPLLHVAGRQDVVAWAPTWL